MKPRHLALGLGVVGAAALVAVLASGDGAPPPRPAPAPTATATAPETTTSHRYRLRLRATTAAALTDGDELAGRLDVDGALTLTPLQAGRYEARLGLLDRAVVTLLGASVPPEALDGAAAVVDFDDAGNIAHIAFSAETAPVARGVLRTLLGEVGPLRYGAAAGTVRRASMFGVGPLAETGEGAHRVRERRGYTSLRFAAADAGAAEVRGRWTLELDDDGVLKALTGGERVTVRAEGAPLAEGRSQIALTRTGTTPVDLAAARRRAGAMVPDPTARQAPGRSSEIAALEQRAGGMTTARLLADVRSYGDAGRMPRHGDWLWRASGWLKLHPEAADALVTEALAPERGMVARGLVADLLASVGHAEAQAALRRLLDAPEVVADARWGELMQHLVLVAEPNDETVAWLGARYGEAPDQERRLAVATVLGAAAGKVARGGSPEAGRAARAPLLTALAEAGDARERAALLDALGNAGLADDVEVIGAWSGSDDPSTRAAAARALRKIDDERARGLLLGLVPDPSAAVSRDAIRALASQELGADAVVALRELVASGALREGAYGALIGLAARTDGADGEVAALLDAVAAAPGAPADVRARAAQARRERLARATP